MPLRVGEALTALLSLPLPVADAVAVPPVPHALLDTVQVRVGAGEVLTLGEGVALDDWLLEGITEAVRGGVGLPERVWRTVGVRAVLPVVETVTVKEGVELEERVTP